MTRLFVDTNIVIDLLEKRPEYAPAAALFTLSDRGEVVLHISALSFANISYILRKKLGKQGVAKVLRDLALIVSVSDLTAKTVQLALNDDDFSDFEDGLQYYSALEVGASMIITRNLNDFSAASIPVLTAAQYLETRGQ